MLTPVVDGDGGQGRSSLFTPIVLKNPVARFDAVLHRHRSAHVGATDEVEKGVAWHYTNEVNQMRVVLVFR